MQDLDKEIEEMRGSDLSPAVVAKLKAPKKTFFFERMGDGFVFPCEEGEAWQICYNKSTWKRRDFRLLGTSDGKTYNRIVSESMGMANKLEPEIEKAKIELSKYMRAEEKLIMDEAVDMDGDPEDAENEANKKKVLRLRTIIDKLHEKLDAFEEEYRGAVSNVVKRATDAELEVAKANQKKRIDAGLPLDWPDEQMNIKTPDASPKRRNKILGIVSNRLD